jgi:hypothetical protein
VLVTANVVPSSSILVTLMMEAIRSFEASVLTRATRRHIPENVIFHSNRLENFKSDTVLRMSHQIYMEQECRSQQCRLDSALLGDLTTSCSWGKALWLRERGKHARRSVAQGPAPAQ